jgi:sugar/nucleoside kinase (ribokinase family)
VSLHAGGGAFITAATLAALGQRPSQFSILPAAPFDAIVLAELAATGVSSELCPPAGSGIDPQITVAMTCGSDRAFLTRASGAAVPPIKATEMAAFSHLHIGELKTLEENPFLIDLARELGMTLSLDCGWQDQFHRKAADLIAAVDLFLPNQSELDALTAIGVPENCAELTVVKNGEKGARARRRMQPDWVHQPTRPVPVVDATGAGDAFNGGFISQWLSGARLETCLETGNACGAISVQSAGGVGGLAGIAALHEKEPDLQ